MQHIFYKKALQETLGDHISQAGSYVDDKVLRFDFTHFEKISAELLKEIEEKVNQIVFEGRPVVIKNMTKEEALASGAMAFNLMKNTEMLFVLSTLEITLLNYVVVAMFQTVLKLVYLKS